MKNDLKVKYLRYLSTKKQDEGFTLIELLVVIIIIGILSAIALPSFLNQANKARESEAKQYVGSMNRAEQAVFLELTEFTTDFGRLGLGIASNTANYTYSAGSPSAANTLVLAGAGTNLSTITHQTGNAKASVASAGSPKATDVLRAYMGIVDVLTEQSGGSNASTTTAVLCQSKKPASIATNAFTVSITTDSTTPACAGDFEIVK